MEGGFPKNLFANTQRLDNIKELNQINSESDEWNNNNKLSESDDDRKVVNNRSNRKPIKNKIVRTAPKISKIWF